MLSIILLLYWKKKKKKKRSIWDEGHFPTLGWIQSIQPMYYRWATTWQNQQNECAPIEDSDQPGHPPSLIRVFAVRSMGREGPKLSSYGQRWLWSDWADAQADLHRVFAGRTVTLLVLSCRGSDGLRVSGTKLEKRRAWTGAFPTWEQQHNQVCHNVSRNLT